MKNIKFDLTFHPQWWHEHANIDFSKDFFVNSRYRIKQDIEMRKALYKHFGHTGIFEKEIKSRPIIDTDLVAGEYLQALLFGCKIKYYPQSYPETIPLNLSDEDILGLKEPDIDNSKVWNNIEEQMIELTDEYGYVESYLDLHGVLNLALDLRGQQLFIDFYENKNLAKKILEICTNLIIKVAKRIEKYSKTLSAGVSSIVKQINPKMFLTSNCTVEMVSNETYEEFLLEYDQIISKEFNEFGIHHCGQTTEHVAKGYKKVENIKFLEVGAYSDVEKVREYFPNLSLNLRYSPVRLKEVSKNQLEDDLKDMIRKAKPFNKTTVSCVGIDAQTKDEKVVNFIEILKKINDREI